VVFALLVTVPKAPGMFAAIARFLPDLDLLFVFFLFFWLRRRRLLSPNNLFVFGFMVDVVNFFPLGLTALDLLLSFKILAKAQQYLMDGENWIHFARDLSMYLFVCMFLRWFLYSLSINNFYHFSHNIMAFSKNMVYGLLLYPFFRNLKNV
jgi:cell shape-determining protein MreD